MGIVFSLLSLTLSAWAIRSICIKKQSGGKKIGKSIFSLWYLSQAFKTFRLVVLMVTLPFEI